MTQNQSTTFFDKKRAAIYDKQREKMAPIKDALHFFMKVILNDLPDNARILCVGVGTGAELFELAQENPGWHFTAVDPAADMLAICKEKAEEKGVAERCSFHCGYMDAVEAGDQFDAATSILVSHFITARDERISYYSAIAKVLKTGGYFINADLSADPEDEDFETLFETWITMARTSGMPETELEKYRTSIGTAVSVLPAQEIEKLLQESGLVQPIQFYQALLIRAWFSLKM